MAGSPGRRHRRGRCDRRRGQRNSFFVFDFKINLISKKSTYNGNTRLHWRKSPSRAHNAVPASDHKRDEVQAPSYWSACRRQSSNPIGAESPETLRQNDPYRSAVRQSASFQRRNRRVFLISLSN